MKARFFNNIKVKDNLVTKSSTDIYKIKSEFYAYYLLPDELKKFFVQPFNYRETGDQAIYDMKYEGITLYEFIEKYSDKHNYDFDKALNTIIEQFLFYFELRNKYTEETKQNNFVYDKVIKRFESLKKLPEYTKIQYFLKANDMDLEELINKFKADYQTMPKIVNKKTIAHGDLHFSNTLVNEETLEIRFIDVKGAMHSKDLYMDYYYDLAKLLHSIEGFYDYIINDEYDISLNDNLDSYRLQINASYKEQQAYSKIYDGIYSKLTEKEKEVIKVYTSSLFLSMLPLHKDSIKRMLAFIKISKKFL